MSIVSETVNIKAYNFIKYYESLGYVIPKHFEFNKWVVKRGTTIDINVKDLQPNSTIKVLCKCDNCDKEKQIQYRQVDKTGKYLCRKCSNNTIEYKSKLSKINLGKKFTEEHKRKIKENNGMKGVTGINHPSYNHELTNRERYLGHNRGVYPGYINWQREVLKRDKKCMKCSNTKNLRTHHINNWKNFINERTNLQNGITLCKDCHKLIHKLYGQLTIREHLNQFMN